MALSVGASKWATKIAREWATERVQWGRPIGQHDAVAQKVAFIAGSAFGLEAMLDVAARMADDKRNDIRIEAALCKVYGSELAWQVVDTLMQVRGGRGYETAASLKARGEKPVAVEQCMRDTRVNRIFEGSSEIMHLLIAREAVDTHLKAAGGLLTGDGNAKAKVDAAMKAGLFYTKWLPQLAVGKGRLPRSYDEFGPLATYLRYVERSAQKVLDGRYSWLEEGIVDPSGEGPMIPAADQGRRPLSRAVPVRAVRGGRRGRRPALGFIDVDVPLAAITLPG
jgi:Acyl-CoA dehydrogenase, C-terminal domain